MFFRPVSQILDFPYKSMCCKPTYQSLGSSACKDPFLYLQKQHICWEWKGPGFDIFQLVIYLIFHLLLLPLPSKGTSAAHLREGKKIGFMPPGSPNLNLGIQMKEGKKANKWSRKWNEDKQSVKNKALFPFIAEPTRPGKLDHSVCHQQGLQAGRGSRCLGEDKSSFQSSDVPSGAWTCR